MAIRFTQRLSRLIRADAHGIVESLEDRSLLLKQHLREAELELTRKRARCEALEDEMRRVAEEASRLTAEITSLDEDVELALSGDKEELARFSVRKLLPKRRALELLRQRGSELAEERQRLQGRLETQEAQLEELKRKVRTRLAAERASDLEDSVAELPAADEEVELELLRRRGAEAPR